jgi:ComF family protein
MALQPICTALRIWGGHCLDAILPRHCVLCGLPCGSGNACGSCRADLPRADHACLSCALPILNAGDLLCGRCLRRAPPWERVVAPLLYAYPVDRLVCRFKFGRDFACGRLLALEMLDAVQLDAQPPPDIIAPVPLHRARHVSRTFNQADLLARLMGHALAIPVHSRLLRRKRRTRAQSGLDAASRKRNIRGAFQYVSGAHRLAAGAHVALVDDVMTTGATLAECAKTLRRAGVARVSVWVAARAPVP